MSCLQTSCQTECSGGDSEACNTCAETNCSAQLDACDWNPTGTTGCMGLNDCLSTCSAPDTSGGGSAATCPTQPGLLCYNDCFGSADQDAIDKLFAYLDCVWGNCETECSGNDQQACQTCVQNNCSTEGMACQND
jgi:hypothetical protein